MGGRDFCDKKEALGLFLEILKGLVCKNEEKDGKNVAQL